MAHFLTETPHNSVHLVLPDCSMISSSCITRVTRFTAAQLTLDLIFPFLYPNPCLPTFRPYTLIYMHVSYSIHKSSDNRAIAEKSPLKLVGYVSCTSVEWFIF